jgi:hypothetical protein
MFIPRQQFLVHGPSDVGQHACPTHDGPPRADLWRHRNPSGNREILERSGFLTLRHLSCYKKVTYPRVFGDVPPTVVNGEFKVIISIYEGVGPDNVVKLVSQLNAKIMVIRPTGPIAE